MAVNMIDKLQFLSFLIIATKNVKLSSLADKSATNLNKGLFDYESPCKCIKTYNLQAKLCTKNFMLLVLKKNNNINL